MGVWSHRAGQDKKRTDKESGVNLEESPGKYVGMVWSCYENRGGLRKEVGSDISTREKEERRWFVNVRADLGEKGMSEEEVA